MKSRPAPAWVIGVVLVGLVVIASLGTAWLVWDRAQEKAQVESDRAAQAASDALQASVGRVLATLRGADGLVDDRGVVDPLSFQAFAQAVASVQEGGSLAYEKVVTAGERQAFERTFGRPIVEFVRPGVFRRARGRESYLPIVSVWPATPPNLGLLGLDLTSEPSRAGTLALAARARDAVLTQLIPLAAGEQGLVAFKPLYAPGGASTSMPVGFVSASFSTGLIAEVLRGLPGDVRARVSVGGTTVFETDRPLVDPQRRSLVLGERRWVVEASGGGPSPTASLGVLAGGLFLAMLVAMFTYSRVVFESRLVAAGEAERQARRRAELFERHAAHLAAAVGVQDVAEVTVADLAASGVELAAVDIVRGAHIEVAASSGISDGSPGRDTAYPIGAETAAAEAIRTGTVVEVATGGEYDERFPSTADVRRAQGVESLIAVPLRDADGDVIGALVAASRAEHWFDAGLRLLVVGVAEQCAVALERARLHTLEREARRRATILQHLAARLSAAARPAEVAEATVPALTEAFDADLAVVGVVSGEEIAVLWATQAYAHEERDWASVPVSAGSIVSAAAGGDPVEAHGRSQIVGFGDGDAAARLAAEGVVSLLMLPLPGSAGCLGVGFRRIRVLTAGERDLLEAIAAELAQTLERATLFEAEREARLRAELMEQNAAHLAAASTVTDVASATVADVETFGADVVYVWQLSGDATLRVIASSDVPASTRRRFDTYPPDSQGIVGDALELGDVDYVGSARAYDERFPALAQERGELGLESLAATPLRTASGEVVGALFAGSKQRRWLDEGGRQLFSAIAEQTGVALERARLFEMEREARRLAELLEYNAGHLAAATSVEDVARSTVADLQRAGIGRATVHVVEDGKIVLLAAAGLPEDAVEAYRIQAVESRTIAGDAIRSGAPIEVSNRIELDELYPESAQLHHELDAGSVIAVPLHSPSGRVVGLLRVTSPEEGTLSPSRRQVVLGVAEQCGVALERATLLAEAERAAATGGFLARLAEALERSTTVAARARRLTEVLTEEWATFAGVHLLGETGDPELVAVSGSRSPGTEDDEGWLQLVERAIRRARAAPRGAAARPSDASLHVLPLRARGHTIGALTVRAAPNSRWDPQISPALAREVAARAAMALDNALLYEREREVSHSLQLGLLGGGLPSFDGVVVTAAYRPGTAALEVGGDWYDAFRLPSGAIALVVGDVVGHGLEAAVAMGQLRGAVGALAQAMRPGRLLERLDMFVENVPAAATATIACVELEAATGRLRYACAGHPPPLVVSPDGRTRFLWEGRSAPLGSMLGETREDAVEALAEGETLVMYTDGLVERRDDSLDAGFERLARAARLQLGTSAALADDIGTAMLEGYSQADDVCILTVHRVPAARLLSHSFTASPPELASLRDRLRTWLDEAGVDPEVVRSTVLAVSEAAANAMEHGYDCDPSGVITVMARLEDDGSLEISVRDEGGWRDHERVDERGRGLPIIESIVDDLAVEREDGATTVRMTRLPTPPPVSA